MSSSAGIITVKFVIPNGGKEIKLYFSPNTQIPNTTWKIDFGDGNGYITGNPDPVKTYTNNTGNDIEIEVKFQITSGAMSGVQIDSNSIGYLKELTVGNSTLVKNGITYETPDLSWGLNAVFTGDSTSGTGTLLDTTYNVTSLTGFFRNATRLTTVPGHLISGIKDLSNLFNAASAFNQYIGNWDTSSVENMSYMFYGATTFNQYIGNWDVSSVTNMNNMFYNNTVFNQNIGYWDTTSVGDMSNMFENASAFNQNISYWNTSSVGSDKYVNMFLNSGIDVNNTYGFTYPTPTSNEFNQIRPPFTPATTDALQAALNKWYELANTDNGDGTYTDTSSTANSVTELDYNGNPITVKYFGNPNTWDVSGITNMSYLFINKTQTNHPDISTWNVSNVTNMYSMFVNAAAFNGDISQWNVSSVKDMSFMFQYAVAFNQDIGKWNVSIVEDMSNMFQNARAFNQDINTKEVTVNGTTYTAWNVSSVTDMSYMFNGASVFNQNISFWKLKDNSVTLTNIFSSSGITNGLYGFDVPTPLSTQFNQDIGLNGYNPVTIERGDTYTDAGAVAASDVTLTTTVNQVDTSVADTYSVTYNGTKGGQSISRIRTVIVEDTTVPVITSSNLKSSIDDGQTNLGSVSAPDEPVTWSIGTNDDGSYVQVNSDGVVSLKQPANYQTKQSYTYTIIATDNVGKEDTVTQTVYIEESTPPVITINGDNPATVEKGSTYTDAGASADTGGTVTTSGTVDTNVIGEYTITYSAMHGISKGTATRTVNVVETMVVDNNVVVELSSNAFIYNSSENATTNDKLDFTKSVFQSLYNSFNQPGKAIKVESIEGGIILPGISEEPIMKPIFLYDGSSKTELTEEEVQDKNIYILTESGQTIKIGTTIITQNSSNYSVTINGVTTTKERGSTFVVGTETFILGSIYIEPVVINSNSCACISQSDPLNNAILDDVSASPAKDSTSDSGNSFSILRNAFRRTYYPVQPAKKEIYGDKDASVIVRQRTMNETSRTLNAVGLPMSFTNGNDSNLVRRSVQRTRNSGGVPNKVAKRGPFQ